MKFSFKSYIKALSGLSINLSAAWFGLAVVTPNFAALSRLETLIALTKDIGLGILFLLLTIRLEEELK